MKWKIEANKIHSHYSLSFCIGKTLNSTNVYMYLYLYKFINACFVTKKSFVFLLLMWDAQKELDCTNKYMWVEYSVPHKYWEAHPIGTIWLVTKKNYGSAFELIPLFVPRWHFFFFPAFPQFFLFFFYWSFFSLFFTKIHPCLSFFRPQNWTGDEPP